MRPTGERGIVDLTLDPRWPVEMPELGAKKDWSMDWLAEKTDKGTNVSMTIRHKDKELVVKNQDLFEMVANSLQVLFLATDIPNEAVPPQLQGHLQPAMLWATLQAQNMLPFMIAKMISPMTTGDGRTWRVDWGYEPNISSSGLVGLDGSKPQTWDGSFRPVMRMTEVIMPRFTGEAHDPQGRDDADSQLVGANTPEAG